ncbi:three-Cys-motif partner protein TcmP [Thermodesulfobacteriota bacterium]
MENTLDLENYKGRTQAFIKHSLLKAYLKRLFFIIGQHEKVIRYVDCFAGPWKGESNDLRDTSIGISLDIMKDCRESLLQRGKDVIFKALYIEKIKKSYKKLDSFLKSNTYDGVEAESLNGEFHNLRENILNWTGGDDFTFFFIDPTGWNNVIEIKTLHPLLKRRRSEFLINFMFDFILRTHSQTQFQEHMINIFGTVPNTEGMTPKEREEYLVKMYIYELKNSLDQTGKKPRASYVKVLDPLKNRTKYHLVYITRHPKGINVFMEESEPLKLIQKEVRAKVQQENRINKSGQGELFPPVALEKEVDGIELEIVKKYWLNKLSFEPNIYGEEQLADMYEETGWFQNDFQRAFNELLDEDKVANLNAKRKRPKKAVHFDEGEFLKKT